MSTTPLIPSIRKVNRKLFGIFLITLVIISSFIFLFTLQEHQNKASLLSTSAITYKIELPPVLINQARQFNLPELAPEYEFLIADLKVMLFLFIAVCLFLIFLLLMAIRSVIKKYNKKNSQAIELSIKNSSTDNEIAEKNESASSEKLDIEAKATREQAPSSIDKQANELQLLANQKIAKETSTIFWALPLKAGSLEQNKLLKYVIDRKSAINPINTWRAIFNHEVILTLLASAKQARLTQKTQHIEVSSLYGDKLAINIDSVSDGWCGTLRNVSPLALTADKNKQLKQQIARVKHQQVLREIEQSNKLSEMIVRTMLQSQSVSIGSGITSWQVYRQLTRIFDWCRQTKIRAQLQLPGNEKILTPVNLRNELTGVVLNILSEVQLQRNQVFLNYSTGTFENVALDNRLFNRMIVAISRLLLVEQFNAMLILNVEAIDFNESLREQRVRFTFKVHTAQPYKKISSAIALLQDNSQEPLPDLIAYIQLLMKYQDVSGLQISLIEQGYQLSFEVALVKEKALQPPEKPINLKHSTVLLISHQLDKEPLLARCFSGTQASVIHCDFTEFSQVNSEYLTSEQLTQRPIDVVVLDGQNYRDMYTGLYSHLENLPEDIRPKLFVMQNNYNAALHQQGLFNQALQPMCPRSLQQNIQQLLLSGDSTNQLISPEMFSSYRFIPTQVEILFAVNEPEKHQTLLRLLNWLGLHVQVVCQSVSMEKYWRSGRYLLLFTELDVSPFVEFSAGKSIKRAIFTFNEQHLQKLSLEKGDLSKVVLSEEVLATVTELPRLIKQLSPWLKPKKSIAPVVVKPEPSLSSRMIEKLKTQSKAEGKATTVHAVDVLLENTAQESNDSEQAIIDLEEFATNQGSAELASFMLTEYVQAITKQLKLVEQGVTENNKDKALKAVASLINYSIILSASDVCNSAQRLQTSLLASVENTPLPKERSAIDTELKELQLATSQLIEFEVSL